VKKSVRIIVSLAGLFIAGYLLFNVWSSFDWSATMKTLSSLALWQLLLILIPFFLEVIADCIGWRHLLPLEFQDASLWKIFKARTGPEAVVMTFPMGPFISEPLKAWILYKIINLKTSIGMVSVIMRSCFLVLAQCSVVILISLLSFGWLQRLSPLVIKEDGLGYLLLLSATILFAVYAGFLLVASRSCVIKRLHNKLEHAPFAWTTKLWRSTEIYFTELNEQFATFGGERKKSVIVAYFLYILPWLFQCAETYVILKILGSDIPLLQALTIEAACGFLRSVAFIVPSGLGIQDAAYFLMLNGAGVSHPLSSAFIILKRSREVLWISLGYGILFVSGFSLKGLVSGEKAITAE
jgi:uncharacterized protein (TIRG00374 family)